MWEQVLILVWERACPRLLLAGPRDHPNGPDYIEPPDRGV